MQIKLTGRLHRRLDLLVANDAAGASGNIELARLIRECREELKRQFRVTKEFTTKRAA